MYFEGGIFGSHVLRGRHLRFFDGLRLRRHQLLPQHASGQWCHLGALAQSIGCCYGHVCDVNVMDMLLRMLPHSPWPLAMDTSMF